MMKKVIALLLIVAALFALSACGGKTPLPSYGAPADGILGTDNLDLMLRKFLNVSDEHPNGDMGERKPFSESEKRMSGHIEELAREITDGAEDFEISVQKYVVSGYGETQNVIARKNGTGKEPRKVVVIGANYDAMINSQTVTNYGTNNIPTVSESVGAMENGTGCATLLTLMQYVKDKSYEFDLEFAFFGDGSYGNTGAARYVSDMSASRRNNILIAFALKRFGGDNVYMYNEEVATDYGKYLLDAANNHSLGIHALPKFMPVINARAISRLPYATWAMVGVHAPFMQEHVPVAAVFSANYETLNLSDIESSSSQVVSFTRNDTYTRLKRDFPSYATQMSAAANLIVESLNDPSFVSAMENGAKSFKNYDAATKSVTVRLVIIGLLVALGVVVIVVAKRFEKKYPYVPPRVKIKVAVFGAEYEDKDADVIIDVKKPDDPFSGY